jgi:hypothetical protein
MKYDVEMGSGAITTGSGIQELLAVVTQTQDGPHIITLLFVRQFVCLCMPLCRDYVLPQLICFYCRPQILALHQNSSKSASQEVLSCYLTFNQT